MKHLRVFPLYAAFQTINPEDFGLTLDQVRAQIWLVGDIGADLKPIGGHLAAAAILRCQPELLLRLLGWTSSTPPFSWLARAVYRFIAKNRHLMPGGTRECKIQDTFKV